MESLCLCRIRCIEMHVSFQAAHVSAQTSATKAKGTGLRPSLGVIAVYRAILEPP
jgi:hypothetical protein